MLKRLRETGRLRFTIFLLALSVYCVALCAFRFLYAASSSYLFLIWNLALAFFPWLVTSVAVLRDVKSRAAILLIAAVWLLFFPNCLYILTDLIHLHRTESAPLWLDLILVLSFAWAGLCFGFVSLMDIEHFLRKRFNADRRMVAVLSVCMIYLAAFGVYVGRFWRWNSWDLLGNPADLMHFMFDRFTDAGNTYRVSGFTLLMGTLLNLMYFPFRYVRRTPGS
ncbi:MAG TPA: DUF1361 domain-containing protein [Spirochaetia bacterium]|nr:DUF1361 domain-containing protein [Spirochaetia bacterium]